MDQKLVLKDNETERGLLDLSVALSSRDVTAGNQFALFVLVRNPFNKPAWIRRVHVSLPSELKLADPAALSKKEQKELRAKKRRTRENLEHHLNEKEKFNQENKELINEKKIKLEAKISLIEKKLENVLSEVGNDFSSDHKEKHLTKLEFLLQNLRGEIKDLSMQESNKIFLNMSGDPKIGMLRIDSKSDGFANIPGDPRIGYLEVYNSDQALKETTQTRTIELESSLPSHAALQPGSTAVYTAALYVKNSIIFTPSQYRLQFNVNYSFTSLTPKGLRKINQVQSEDTITQEIINNSSLENEEALFTNTVAHEISIRPSVYSIMLGSTIGGSVGSLARLLQINPSLSWESFTEVDFLVGIAVSIILSAVAIVFMARKSDTQSFLSVEDFWGGVLIGFLIGYTGASFFQELTGVASPST